VGQPRLADAGLADDADQPAGALAHPLPGLAQQVELDLAPDQHREALVGPQVPARQGGVLAQKLVGVVGRDGVEEVVPGHALHADIAAGGLARPGGGGDDGAAQCAHELGGRARRRADHLDGFARVGIATGAAAQQGLAGVDAGAQPGGPFRLDVDDGFRRKCCAAGEIGVLLGGVGRPEDRRQRPVGA
jgi:hypothetical protein